MEIKCKALKIRMPHKSQATQELLILRNLSDHHEALPCLPCCFHHLCNLCQVDMWGLHCLGELHVCLPHLRGVHAEAGGHLAGWCLPPGGEHWGVCGGSPWLLDAGCHGDVAWVLQCWCWVDVCSSLQSQVRIAIQYLLVLSDGTVQGNNLWRVFRGSAEGCWAAAARGDYCSNCWGSVWWCFLWSGRRSWEMCWSYPDPDTPGPPSSHCQPWWGGW